MSGKKMKTKIEINNQSDDGNINKKALKDAAKLILKELGEEITVSIVLCKREVIKELNITYRNKDKETDVLSFVYDNEGIPLDAESFFGEIIICPDVAKEQASQYSNDYNSEIKRLLVHGILHLAGYDHEAGDEEEKIMFEKQDELLLKLEEIKVC
jgi:probable rRNA maturation factor